MKRFIVSVITIGLLAGIVGYAAGLFTQEERQEFSCTMCRAIRHDGKTYGVQYSRVEDTEFTPWYRDNIDPGHGVDQFRPHTWHRSTGPTAPAVFLLRPEVQLTVMHKIPDRLTQAAVLRSINSSSRELNVRRVRLLVEFAHVDAKVGHWNTWWARNSHVFGLGQIGPAASVAR